jgi:hypothetical protein
MRPANARAHAHRQNAVDRTGKAKPTGTAFRTAAAGPPRDRFVHDVRTHCVTTSTKRSRKPLPNRATEFLARLTQGELRCS